MLVELHPVRDNASAATIPNSTFEDFFKGVSDKAFKYCVSGNGVSPPRF
jgi:hypothetical protein